MKLVVLTENSSCREDLTAEHGLSLYIEMGDHKILFDMGQTDAFARNAQTLGIDLSQVDIAILSHGHYDHGGGLNTFLRLNSKAPIYVHEKAFGQFYNGKEKYIGLDPGLAAEPRLIRIKGSRLLTPGVLLTDCSEETWNFDPYGLNQKCGDSFLPDDFSHEQYLVIREGEKQIVFSGCSHRGIQNIACYFAPNVLIGGFHLNKVEDTQQLHAIAKTLSSYGTLFYTGHCTGRLQFSCMKESMGEHLQALSTGTVIII